MTREERHFLNCDDQDCGRAYCVARRYYERQIGRIRSELKNYKVTLANKLDKAILDSTQKSE